jgi:hypothetical protein
MRCKSCQSTSQVKLPAEIAIHFPGRENLNTPHVFVFPDVFICLDCGSTNFTVPEAELQSIRARASLSSYRRELIDSTQETN